MPTADNIILPGDISTSGGGTYEKWKEQKEEEDSRNAAIKVLDLEAEAGKQETEVLKKLTGSSSKRETAARVLDLEAEAGKQESEVLKKLRSDSLAKKIEPGKTIGLWRVETENGPKNFYAISRAGDARGEEVRAASD